MIFLRARLLRQVASLFIALLVAATLPAMAAEKMRLRVDDYQIDAELTPHGHRLAARAKVKFTALEDLNTAVFQFAEALLAGKIGVVVFLTGVGARGLFAHVLPQTL